MRLFNQVALRDGLAVAPAVSSIHSRLEKARPFPGRWAALLLVVAAFGSVVTTIALAAGAGQITFFGDMGNSFGSKPPFVRDASYFLVRPSQLLLTEDGSVVLENLRWSGWGTSVAQATGDWSASDCTPSCADGKLTTSPARLTLSSPGIVLGHRVYRCFRIDPPHPGRDILDQGCLHRDGTYQQSPTFGYQ